MIKSFIYDEINEKYLNDTGFFFPKENWQPLKNVNYIDNLNKAIITKDTLILYYTGAFGCFHEGHLNVIKRAYKKGRSKAEKVIVVIAPSNSEYTLKKYGDSNFSSNFERYQKIKEFEVELKKYNVFIDLNPMLNHRCDQNFTDLLLDFINRNIGCIELLKNKPFLIGGKDRNFSIINKLTKKIGFWFFKEKVIKSSSKDCNRIKRKKSDLLLRVHTEKEFQIVKKHLSRFYASISPIFIKDELHEINEMIKSGNVKTICKDYNGLLPYIPLSRFYDLPLSIPYHKQEDKIYFETLECIEIVDSDIFSGSTKNFIESCGLKFKALLDLSEKENIELLDIDDLKDDKFNYPYVDLSYRCSLPPFNIELHEIIKNLKKELKDV